MILRVPTELTEEQTKEYQRIYKEKYGDDISLEEAHELGLSLVRLIALVIGNRRRRKKI
jgi:hypothetical protein